MVELIIAAAITLIVALSVGVVLVNSHRGYEITYDRVYADIVTDGHIAKRLFDAIIRKSSSSNLNIDTDGSWIEVFYYSDFTSSYLDGYARFYVQNSQLKMEYGTVDSLEIKQAVKTNTVCSNVSSCFFKRTGNSVTMTLTLSENNKTNTVVSSAYLHN